MPQTGQVERVSGKYRSDHPKQSWETNSQWRKGYDGNQEALRSCCTDLLPHEVEPIFVLSKEQAHVSILTFRIFFEKKMKKKDIPLSGGVRESTSRLLG